MFRIAGLSAVIILEFRIQRPEFPLQSLEFMVWGQGLAFRSERFVFRFQILGFV